MTVSAGPYSTASYVGSAGNTSATASPFTDPNGPGVCGQNSLCSYRIRAEIGADTSQTPWSSWAAVAPSFTPPTLNSAGYVDNGVSLSFSAPSVPAGSTITSYDYEISTDGGTTVSAGPYSTASYVGSAGNTSATASPFTDPNGPGVCGQNGSCSYRIRAEIGAGDEWQTPWSSWAAVASPGATVTFDANGGTGTMTQEAGDAPAALTANAFTRAGFSFAGWNTAADGSGTAYADGASYPFTASVTLYAQWTASTFTVTFDANGGTGTMAQEAGDAPAALTANAFTRAGFSFAGWNTAADGSGTAYADGASYPFTANVTLYAQWTTAT